MAFVRLKRSLDEEPIDTLLIAFKKRKEDQTSVFKFATTLLDKKEDVFQQISKVVDLVDSQKLYKQKRITNITEKLRKENKLYSQNSRLKLVNCLRESVESRSNDDTSGSAVTLLEIESNRPTVGKETQTTSTTNTEVKEMEATKYVYDIYYAPNSLCDIDMTSGDTKVSCHIIDTELAFESYRDDAYGLDDVEEDEDDSNDENNWRNDYPDEDEDSIDEEDMRLAAKYSELNIDGSYDLSSDEEDEELINSIDVNAKDIAMFGEGYAKYKRRIQKENLVSDNDDTDNDYNEYISCSDSD